MFSIFQNIKKERDYTASTGLTKAKFKELFVIFKTHYQPKPFNLIANLPAVLTDPEEALFFILYHLKTYTSYHVLGLCFGFSDCTAIKYVEYIKPFLKHCLAEKSAMCHRIFATQSDFDKAFEGIIDLYIDGTEIPVQRNHLYESQKNDFSGKKKAIPFYF